MARTARPVREVRAPDGPEALTPREAEVLALLGRAKATSVIARELGLGQQTVRSYVSHILGKLGVRSRTQAALYALEMGLAPTTELSDSSDREPPAGRRPQA